MDRAIEGYFREIEKRLGPVYKEHPADPRKHRTGLGGPIQITARHATDKKEEDDFTEEEQALMVKVDEESQKRKLELYNKEQQEMADKNQRKMKAQTDLSQWKAERDTQIKQRRTNNVIEEK